MSNNQKDVLQQTEKLLKALYEEIDFKVQELGGEADKTAKQYAEHVDMSRRASRFFKSIGRSVICDNYGADQKCEALVALKRKLGGVLEAENNNKAELYIDIIAHVNSVMPGQMANHISYHRDGRSRRINGCGFFTCVRDKRTDSEKILSHYSQALNGQVCALQQLVVEQQAVSKSVASVPVKNRRAAKVGSTGYGDITDICRDYKKRSRVGRLSAR